MIKLPGTFICVVALVIHAFGALYQDLGDTLHQQATYRKLVISCARNSYSTNMKNLKKTESPQDTKNRNPADHNEQSGCVHSGTAALVTTPQRFKRPLGKGSSCSH